MRRGHERTLNDIFEDPVRSDLEWRAVESLFRALGAEISRGRGSRVRVALNGVRATFHRPHPDKEVGRAMIRSIREFLTNAGVG